MLGSVEAVFREIVGYCVLLLEAVGAGVILVPAIRAIPLLVKDRQKSHLMLTEGIMTGLSFLLSSEGLKTLIAPDWKDVGMTCAVLAMRAGITILVRWENKKE